MWTFQLDAGRARHAPEPMILSMSTPRSYQDEELLHSSLSYKMPDVKAVCHQHPAVRPWFLGGRLIALKRMGVAPHLQ